MIGHLTSKILPDQKCSSDLGFDFQDAELVQKLIPLAQEGGLLIDWFLFNDSSIRIAPPLTITDMELDEAADILINALDMLAVNHSVPFV